MYCGAFIPVFTFVTGLICSNTAGMNLLELSHWAPASVSLRSKLRELLSHREYSLFHSNKTLPTLGCGVANENLHSQK